MKGFYIYENDAFPKKTDCVKLNYVSHQVEIFPDPTITISFQGDGSILEKTYAQCSKKDTYDFEVGALIALMKICGREKVTKACDELYKDDNYMNALQEMTENCEKLIEENKRLNDRQPSDLPRRLKYKNEILKKDNERLINTRDLLIHENNKLNAQIESLRTQIGIMAEKETDLMDANKSLTDARDRLLNESMRRLRDKIDLKEKYVALKAENEKLKLDCEKLQHGYLDTNMIFCGGRQNGKQYTLLVDLFKNIDQKKVDTAYKEAYNTTLPVWQKEVLKQMYDIHKESKEKIELPRTLDINGTVYRKSIQIKDFGEQITKLSEESSKKPDVSKREQMWDNILKEGRTPVYVKREDIHDFLEECQAVGITWVTGKLPLETIPFHISAGYDGVYFFLHGTGEQSSKSTPGAKEFRHVMTWWTTACPAEAQAAIHYIRPMRWDLFKKGRIVVACTEEEVPEFREKAKRELGNIRIEKYSIENLHCNGPIKVYYHYDKDINWLKPLLVSGIPRVKINNHKVIHWEDVR